MTLISQLKNYLNKLFSKKYRIGDEVKFIQKIDSIPTRMRGVIEDINELHTFPYTIKLSDSFSHNGYTVSYINIDKKQIL